MEEFNKIFEEAEKAQKNLPDALKELKKMHRLVKKDGQKHVSDEQMAEIDKAYKNAMGAKKKLDEYNGTK